MIPPLHNHLEYEGALKFSRILKNKAYITSLSDNEKREQKEINKRIYMYRRASLKHKVTL